MSAPKKIPAIIIAIEDHLEGVRSFVLAPQRRIPRFSPGQFLHLAIDPYDPSMHWPESRVFSICSPPDSKKEIRITISKVGKFTSKMMALKEGAEVWLKFPYGDFTISSDPEVENILIAGGTGITPFMSWVKSNASINCSAQIVYGVRSPEHLIYASELQKIASENKNIKWIPFIENGELPGENGFPKATHARLNVTDILNECDVNLEKKKYHFYISGPPQMIDVIKSGLQDEGIANDCIFVDAW